MLQVNHSLLPQDLLPSIQSLWAASRPKLESIHNAWHTSAAAPVVTRAGQYGAQGWTEWTRGFQYGSCLLQFDATDDHRFLAMGMEGIRRHLVDHVTHFGVHDHGFNIVSTFGVLHRLLRAGRVDPSEVDPEWVDLALMASGAVQARRWSSVPETGGFVHSFNGPHSLFADTMRSMRSLALAHLLGQTLHAEQDAKVSLLHRLVLHARTTAKYSVYYGEGRDAYDVRGRTAHESLFNPANGVYRCPSTQQGYSPFTTWTRGLAWVVLGFAELLEMLPHLAESDLDAVGGKQAIEAEWVEAATASADYFCSVCASDGIPYWDSGAPGLVRLTGWQELPADPYNEYEPVDSSAAAIAAQGLLRLSTCRLLDADQASTYRQAGFTVASALLGDPYLSLQDEHQGLLRHSIYHRPNGWDYVPPGSSIPCGEASMWGDYHLRELALLIDRTAAGGYNTQFFAGVTRGRP